jgi:phospholipase/carboxylesterase
VVLPAAPRVVSYDDGSVKRVAILAVLSLAAVALGFGVSHVSQAAPEPPLQFVERVLGGAATDELPLLIALHGLGDSPESFIELFDDLGLPLRVVAPRAPDPYAVGTSWFPIDDPKRAPDAIVARAALIVKLVEHLRSTRKIRGKPIVMGFSQGGMLSFALAAYHPARFAAALPIAGMLPASLPAFQKAPKGFRVIAFHGREDARIPYADGERTVARLKRAGTEASLTGFEGVGHSVPLAMQRRFAAALKGELSRAPAQR